MEEEAVLWGKHTWPEISELSGDRVFVVLPVGSTEQHGPHLALDTDHYVAYRLSIEAARRAWEKGFKVLVLPPVPFGLSEHWMKNPGTITLRPSTFISLVEEVLESVWSHGFKKVIIVNGHGGNTHALNVAANEVIHRLKDHELLIVVFDWWRFIGPELKEIIETPLFHADEGETSVALALGQRARMEALQGKEMPLPQESEWRTLDPSRSSRLRLYRFNPNAAIQGAFGIPEKASAEKGKRIVEVFAEKFIELLSDLMEPEE
jgi:creatinine amidohydrolase